MAEKDILEKSLIEYNDVFADIMNVLLFHGKKVIVPEKLQDAGTFSLYMNPDNGKVHSQLRDVAKYWNEGSALLSRLGIENQTSADSFMPMRMISYDGAAYRSQLTKEQLEKPKYPVLSVVLHLDYRKNWDTPTHLSDCFPVSDEIRPYFQDYGINLFEVSALSDEQVANFQSDFRVVADFFVQMRKNRDYHPTDFEILHVKEVLELMSALTGDHSYIDVFIESQKEGKEICNMCEVVEKFRAEGRQEGIAKGRQEGIAKGRQEGIAKGRQEGIAEGRQEGIAEGRQEGIAEGRQEGVDLLFSAIMRLKAGETADQIIASGIPETIIRKALLIK